VEKDRMEIFDANVLIQFFTEENSIVMSAEPTLACYSKFFNQQNIVSTKPKTVFLRLKNVMALCLIEIG